jgi:hypothetical protein
VEAPHHAMRGAAAQSRGETRRLHGDLGGRPACKPVARREPAARPASRSPRRRGRVRARRQRPHRRTPHRGPGTGDVPLRRRRLALPAVVRLDRARDPRPAGRWHVSGRPGLGGPGRLQRPAGPATQARLLSAQRLPAGRSAAGLSHHRQPGRDSPLAQRESQRGALPRRARLGPVPAEGPLALGRSGAGRRRALQRAHRARCDLRGVERARRFVQGHRRAVLRALPGLGAGRPARGSPRADRRPRRRSAGSGRRTARFCWSASSAGRAVPRCRSWAWIASPSTC